MLVGYFAFGKVLHRTVISEFVEVSFGQFGKVLDFYEFLDEAQLLVVVVESGVEEGELLELLLFELFEFEESFGPWMNEHPQEHAILNSVDLPISLQIQLSPGRIPTLIDFAFHQHIKVPGIDQQTVLSQQIRFDHFHFD